MRTMIALISVCLAAWTAPSLATDGHADRSPLPLHERTDVSRQNSDLVFEAVRRAKRKGHGQVLSVRPSADDRRQLDVKMISHGRVWIERVDTGN